MADDRLIYNWDLYRDLRFDAAKRWWIASVVGKVLPFLLGLYFIWQGYNTVYTVIAVAAVSVASDICQLRSDSIKSDAEAILRKLDFRDSFGWDLTASDALDLLARVPDATFSAITAPRTEEEQPYFSSTAEPGPLRAAENFLLSSWWSKHLATDMFLLCLGLTIAAITVILGTMLLVLASCHAFGTEQGPAEQVSRIATSSVLLVFSAGLVRLTIGYWKFSNKADLLARKFEDLVKQGAPNHTDVLKAIGDYHLARASSPLIPTWIQNMRKARLNRLWAQFRA
ncbi:hypothetical protein D3C72_535040 [compost metagenome]